MTLGLPVGSSQVDASASRANSSNRSMYSRIVVRIFPLLPSSTDTSMSPYVSAKKDRLHAWRHGHSAVTSVRTHGMALWT